MEWRLEAPQHSAGSVKRLQKQGQLEESPVARRGAAARIPGHGTGRGKGLRRPWTGADWMD